jgi:polysaccharide transporter, PST family
LIRQVLIGNVILCVQYAVGGLVPIVLIPHIVRSIGLAAYGDLAVALVWASYGAVLVQYAFQFTGPKRLTQLMPGETSRTVFMDIASAKVLLLVPAMACMCLVGGSFSSGQNANAQWTLMLLLPVGAALHTGWHLQTAGRFLWVCIVSIAGACAALSIGFVFVKGPGASSVIGASAALSAGPIFAGAATFIVSLFLLKHEPLTGRSASPVSALREGWPLFISQFTSALYSASGPLVIRYAAGAEAAGAYSTVERIVNAVLGACLLTHTAAYPRLAALYGSNREGYWRLMRFVALAYVACSLPIVVGAVLTREALTQYLFGEAKPDNADALLGCALVWLMIGILGPALTGYLTVSGQQRQVWPLTLKVLCVAIVVGIPGCFVFGAWAWMGALVVSQVPVFLAAARAWRKAFISEDK